jgi:RNA polymerase sigma factor (sigma-70 family)
MAPHAIDGSQTAGMGFKDFSRPGVKYAADEPEGTGDPGGEGEFDRSYWDRFYADWNAVILAALSRQAIQPADREDCCQQIWVDLLATRMSGFHGGNPSAWLAALARNKATDIVRRMRRRPVGLASGEWEGRSVDPAESCLSAEAAAVVRAALSVLERQIERRSFDVFVLHCLDGLPFGQIAVALNLTPEQARARHHRAKAKFRRIVEESDFRGQADAPDSTI